MPTAETLIAPPEVVRSAPSGWSRDFALGGSTALTLAVAFTVYRLGEPGFTGSGSLTLLVAVTGMLAGQLLKLGLLGRFLTAGEALQDLFAMGVLAVASSPLEVLHPPDSWSQLILLSSVTASAMVGIYQAANAYTETVYGRHLGPMGAAILIATPFAVGDLTLLESPRLLQTLGALVVLPVARPWFVALDTAGRVMAVCAFNELVVNGMALATCGKLVRPLRAHMLLWGIGAASVAAAWIALAGSTREVAAAPLSLRWLGILATTILSQAGLWAEIYLVTGLLLDAIHNRPPGTRAMWNAAWNGAVKGAVFGGVFMAIVLAVGDLGGVAALRNAANGHPLLLGTVCGAAAFPLAKTLIETFDGSEHFFGRLAASYRSPALYARGLVAGCAVGFAVAYGLPGQPTGTRAWYGFVAGIAASAGVSLVRDAARALRGGGRLQSPRVYCIVALMGGFIGMGLAFYFDTPQLTTVVSRFYRYVSFGGTPRPFIEYPLLSAWGMVRVGYVRGGVSVLFAESLAGVLSWALPAWLFVVNGAFLRALFDRETAPIKALFHKDGLVAMVENTVYVFRWALWMSPIIRLFLRPMGTPSWYNQDGGVRTLVATVQYLRLSHTAFASWSLNLFVYLLAFPWVRILIWLDQFGLRVGTLVNLSFIGTDRLDRLTACFLAPHATAHSLPEAVKRFTTWAPLLIPFYIPRGADWDYAWNTSQSLRAGAGSAMAHFPLWAYAAVLTGGTLAGSVVFRLQRWRRDTHPAPNPQPRIANAVYEVTAGEEGDIASRALVSGYDVSRRAYDRIDPASRILFVVDDGQAPGSPGRMWPVIGNYPAALYPPSLLESAGGALRIENDHRAVRTEVQISLPGEDDPAEMWTVTLTNRDGRPRRLWLAFYLEWVLDGSGADRGHTQYNRLFTQIAYLAGLHAALAWNRHSRAMGLLACDAAPEGFLASRIDFIGRAGTVWRPRALETLDFAPAVETAPHPTLDPAAALLLPVPLEPGETREVRLLMGLVDGKRQALDLIQRYLGLPTGDVSPEWPRAGTHPILHGRIPPGTPPDYAGFADEGRQLIVRTPLTPRPFDHTVANALGQVTVVTNRGLHTTSSVNSQQNRLTPDWPDLVTREVPGEAIYLYDVENGAWYSPTYEPLRDPAAVYEAEYSVDGTATFRGEKDTLSTELTVFVPPGEPATVYLLNIRNSGLTRRRIAVTSYFQLVLAGQPEYSGKLRLSHKPDLGALFFENPRNTFRSGPAFVLMWPAAAQYETERGRFLGPGGSVAHPYFAEHGTSDGESPDERPVAALRRVVEVAPGTEARVAIVLGQAGSARRARAAARKYRNLEFAEASLAETRRWWLALTGTVQVRTADPAFDAYIEWVKYQALTERIYARRGFYQASGAFGFRDQLQDAVNLMWLDPLLARRQIVLHSAQQFPEGDVVHWFHMLQDGRTGFVARTHASDNLLWLGWAVVDYLAATGDVSVLDERTPYLEAERPLADLPADKEGMGFDPLRSPKSDTVYRHVMRAIDLVLDSRMGVHGLPLMGTGDWNDGLDAIGSEGRGESVWLAFFLYYILERLLPVIHSRDGAERHAHYQARLNALNAAIETTWRGDRYLRAIHDDGTGIGVAGSGIWEIDALTAAWAVMSGINPERSSRMFETALEILEHEKTILLGWPPLREDSRPYLGRSSKYPEGVRENGMYCHGVQWLVGAARILAERCERGGQPEAALRYRRTAWRLWMKIAAIGHALPGEIEIYGGQPNQQAADMVTTFDPGRMIWSGYTGAAGWMFRQAIEGVLGARLADNRVAGPTGFPAPVPELGTARIDRDLSRSPLRGDAPDESRGRGQP